MQTNRNQRINIANIRMRTAHLYTQIEMYFKYGRIQLTCAPFHSVKQTY